MDRPDHVPTPAQLTRRAGRTLATARSHTADLLVTASSLLFLLGYAWPILEPDLSRGLRDLCTTLVVGTWVVLAVDIVRRLVRADDRWAFVRHHPIEVAAVILPLLRPLQALRLMTLLSTFNRYAGSTLRGKVGLYLTGSIALIVFVAALAVLDAERGGDGPIQDFGDAVWWSFTTITTVGYGDTYPVTGEGRVIAVVLMLGGIAVLGVVTATLASWFLDQVRDAQDEEDEVANAELLRTIQSLREEVAALRGDVRGGPPADGR